LRDGRGGDGDDGDEDNSNKPSADDTITPSEAEEAAQEVLTTALALHANWKAKMGFQKPDFWCERDPLAGLVALVVLFALAVGNIRCLSIFTESNLWN
jgi:hypothetical protein